MIKKIITIVSVILLVIDIVFWYILPAHRVMDALAGMLIACVLGTIIAINITQICNETQQQYLRNYNSNHNHRTS